MALDEYRAKRHFDKTPEPGPERAKPHQKPIFVIQEHHASRLHYDFRLEADGVLKSWAVPREPSLDPSQKRLAVHVEDHPLAYASFEGTIPRGQYGAGTVEIWDHGTYDNLLADKPTPRTVSEGIEAGRLEFVLHGEKLRGRYALIRMKGGRFGDGKNWLLIKMKDEFASASGASGEAPRPRRKAAKQPRAARPTTNGKAPRAGVVVSHPEKVLYPDAGYTKADVAEYYRKIARRLLPHLRDRPVTLERLPDGLGEDRPHFWQKDTPEYYPAWIPGSACPAGAARTSTTCSSTTCRRCSTSSTRGR